MARFLFLQEVKTHPSIFNSPPARTYTYTHRLPAFTPEDKVALQGSADFVGINYYFSYLCSTGEEKEKGSYGADMNVTFSEKQEWEHTQVRIGWERERWNA